jgi:hypothetical protein
VALPLAEGLLMDDALGELSLTVDIQQATRLALEVSTEALGLAGCQ